HYNMPKNIEGYYQEIGRAGRDGIKSDTVLFYSFADVMNLRKFAEESKQRELQLAKLDRMQEYAEAFICRRKMLLAYFNDQSNQEKCGNCDVCQNPPEHFDGTVLAQKALSAVARLKQQVGIGMLIDVLRGSSRYEILEKGYDKIKTYGAGRDNSQRDWQEFIQQFIQMGLLDIAYDQKNTLKLNVQSQKVLFEGEKVSLVKLSVIEKQKKKVKATTSKAGRERVRDELFEVLRELRTRLSRQEGIAPYMIFSDATLEDMAASRPSTRRQMLAVSGVGSFKMDKYGKQFLDEISDFIDREIEQGKS
ncbi:MAG: RQC domain-containing protein, partial [Bacteroidota bacterium]